MSDNKTDLVVRPSAEIVPTAASPTDVVVLARDPVEMATAQQGLIKWFTAKLVAEKAQFAECEENLEIAKGMKVRTRGWTRQVSLAKKRVVYYEKGLAALLQGYCIVPDFPVQVFAVRTDKESPPSKVFRWGGVPDVEPRELKKGEGEYVAADPTVLEWTTEGSDPPKTKRTHHQAVDFREVDFPFKLVKPQILTDLDEALKLKLFDEIGVLPATARQPDPVLVGRIKRKTGTYSEHVLTFLITWWIDTRSL